MTPKKHLQPVGCVFKHSRSLGQLIIKPVPKELAKKMIIEHHYSHKWNNGGFGKYNFGIFQAENLEQCLGVAVYGYMKNCRAHTFIHPNPEGWMCELNRLWISDDLGKNAETILIAASIKLLRQADPNIVAIQSFADGRLGCGTIYKAANFRYYGYHETIFLRDRRTGEVTHQQLLTNSTSPSGFLRTNIYYLLGLYDTFKVKTYRYIYPLSNQFISKFKEQPYPEYEKGETPFEWVRDRQRIKIRMYELLEKIV
ncbi:hypothetical protein [Millionella massiliensis]|uniref:Mom family adenine methylcarbamoylation protein n=1 Tax=Millionella massiliensis TaxID=1871023 RepID=UPI0024B78D69|nr:hypothetical protein [Millionella massiliensis]